MSWWGWIDESNVTIIKNREELENKYRAYEWEEIEKDMDWAWYD